VDYSCEVVVEVGGRARTQGCEKDSLSEGRAEKSRQIFRCEQDSNQYGPVQSGIDMRAPDSPKDIA
jgi:hypothetical protein